MTLPQFSSLAHSIPFYIMGSTANPDTILRACCSSLRPALVRGQGSTTCYVIIFFIAAGFIFLNPEYAKPTHRHARSRVFLALGLSGILPFSLIARSWITQISPSNGLYLARGCGRDVCHGNPTIVMLFPLQSPDSRLIWLDPQLAHIESKRDSTLVDSTISFRLIKSSMYSLSSLLFRCMSVC